MGTLNDLAQKPKTAEEIEQEKILDAHRKSEKAIHDLNSTQMETKKEKPPSAAEMRSLEKNLAKDYSILENARETRQLEGRRLDGYGKDLVHTMLMAHMAFNDSRTPQNAANYAQSRDELAAEYPGVFAERVKEGKPKFAGLGDKLSTDIPTLRQANSEGQFNGKELSEEQKAQLHTTLMTARVFNTERTARTAELYRAQRQALEGMIDGIFEKKP